MKFYPSIDLRSGKCVRLQQGSFEHQTVYEVDPIELALSYAKAGCTQLHVVDLDGAKSGKSQQADLILEIAKTSGLNVQVGGGIRTIEDIQYYLTNGIQRVVIGSLAVKNPLLLLEWIKQFGGDKFVLACDICYEDGQTFVAIQGWQDRSDKTLWDVLDTFAPSSLRYLLCTDIFLDGMLAGPKVELYREIKQHYPQFNIQASGGVHSMENIQKLDQAGVEGFIVGKALYEKRLNLDDLKPWY